METPLPILVEKFYFHVHTFSFCNAFYIDILVKLLNLKH